MEDKREIDDEKGRDEGVTKCIAPHHTRKRLLGWIRTAA